MFQVRERHVYRHRENGVRYIVTGFPKMRRGKGDWVTGVAYTSETDNDYVRPLEDFTEAEFEYLGGPLGGRLDD